MYSDDITVKMNLPISVKVFQKPIAYSYLMIPG